MIRKISRVFQRIGIGKLLLEEVNLNPIVFFFIIILIKLDLVNLISLSIGLILIGLLFLIACGYNCFFYCSSILVSNMAPFSWIAGVLLILSANQIWKMYLCTFILGYSIFDFRQDLLSIY